MTYFDAYVAAVPTANREAYRKAAEISSAIFRDHGARAVTECWGDDVPEGKLTSFPKAVQCKPDETVVFGFIVWPSRAARDEGIKNAFADPRMDPKTNPMPFDGARMIHGGFESIIESWGKGE